MEAYHRKIKAQTWLLAAGTAILIAVQALAFAGVIKPVAGGARWLDYWNGFMAGVAMGMSLLFLIGLVKNILALRSEKRLQKQYVKESDERLAKIHELGKSTGATIFLLCSMPALIVCGYFNVTVFFSCLACVLALSLIIAASKLYYKHKL